VRLRSHQSWNCSSLLIWVWRKFSWALFIISLQAHT
jgi:hypothetical protein